MKNPILPAPRRLKSILLNTCKNNGVSVASSLCAMMMLCVVPLVFRDAFFDINRIKVYTVCAAVPVITVLMLVALFLDRGASASLSPNRHVRSCFAAMGAFLASCLASYFASGMSASVLLGNQGRYCGLLFFLCCGVAFYIIACGENSCERLYPAIVICASAVALLGILNALGVDPLGFYARIKRGQEQMFMSTIGHFDFFGTYLVMLLPLAGSMFVFSKNHGKRIIGLSGLMLIALGACAARTDSALIGIHLGCAALLALSAGSPLLMSRAFAAWAISFAALPMMNVLLRFGRLGVSFSGPHALMCDTHFALLIALALACAAAVFFRLYRRGARQIGRGRAVVFGLSALLGLVLLYLALTVYFTYMHPETDLGAASGFLRFDDAWGSYRGFVYTRALDAFASYSPAEKLFGRGLDTTKLILEPYFDHPVIGIVGVFDDAHCHLLQLLLTGGLFCAGSFAAFYVMMLIALYHCAGYDPLLCGVVSSVFAYSVVMLINVTQPILIVTYFSLCGLGFSRVGFIAKRRRKQE